MLTVVGSSIGYILKRDRWIHTEPFGNGLQPIWPESSFGVNVNSLKKRENSQNTELGTTAQQAIGNNLMRANLPLTFPSAPPSEMGIWQVTHNV